MQVRIKDYLLFCKHELQRHEREQKENTGFEVDPNSFSFVQKMFRVHKIVALEHKQKIIVNEETIKQIRKTISRLEYATSLDNHFHDIDPSSAFFDWWHKQKESKNEIL